MADNYQFTAGSGTTAAADEIGGVKYPRAKLIHGADGTNDGDVSTANPLPVEVTDSANTVAADTATIAGAVSGTEMQVDVVSGTIDTVTTLTGGGVADNGVDSGNPVKVGAVYNASAPTYADGDRSDLQSSVNGFLKVTLGDVISIVGADSAEQDSIGVNAVWRSDSGTATITSADATTATAVTAVSEAAKRIYITDLIISVDTAMNVQVQDDAGTPSVMMEQVYLPANSVFSKSFTTPIRTGVNQDVNVIASASGNISVTVGYYKI